MKPFLLFFFLFVCITNSYAEESIDKQIDSSFIIVHAVSSLEAIVSFMASILFFKIMEFPLLVLWLVVGGLFFTVKLSRTAANILPAQEAAPNPCTTASGIALGDWNPPATMAQVVLR